MFFYSHFTSKLKCLDVFRKFKSNFQPVLTRSLHIISKYALYCFCSTLYLHQSFSDDMRNSRKSCNQTGSCRSQSCAIVRVKALLIRTREEHLCYSHRVDDIARISSVIPEKAICRGPGEYETASGNLSE